MKKERKISKTTKILLAVLVIVILGFLYFTFIFNYKCDNNDLACYKAHQEKCVKTKFKNDVEEVTWYYRINGKAQGQCEIYTEILRVKEGTIDKAGLEGKSMVCSLPLESSVMPDSDLSRCHGLLKEELQNLIIKKLHNSNYLL